MAIMAKNMEVCKVCNNVKINTLHYFHGFCGLQLNIRKNRQRVFRMWLSALKTPKETQLGNFGGYTFGK